MLGDFASRVFTELVWPVVYAKYLSHYSIPRLGTVAVQQKETAVMPASPFARKVLKEAELPKMELFDYRTIVLLL